MPQGIRHFIPDGTVSQPGNTDVRLLHRPLTTTSNSPDQTAVVASYATEFTPNIEFAVPQNGTDYTGVVFYATFFFGANNLIDRPPNTNQRCRYTLTIRPTTTPPTPALTHTPTTLDATTATTTANLTATSS